MKRTIFLCFAVMTFLSGCVESPSTDTQSLSSSSSSSSTFSASSSQTTTPPYFSFEDYGEMTKSCNTQAIKERFQALGTPDLPSIPYRGVRLCESDLLILELQSVSA